MIIEQHIPAPTGYVSARVILFRGTFEEENEPEGDDPPPTQTEPTWDEFKAIVTAFTKRFTSADIEGFSLKRKSAYLNRAAKQGLVRKTGDKLHRHKLKPYDIYEVTR